MRHHVFGNQLGRNTNQAKALYRILVRQLFDRGKIETTLAKAKAVAPMVDKVMTFAKKNTVAARREVTKILGDEKMLDKIFGEVAPKYTNRHSGYSRIIRLGQRYSDSAKLAILELVEGKAVEPEKPAKIEEVAKIPKSTTRRKKAIKK